MSKESVKNNLVHSFKEACKADKNIIQLEPAHKFLLGASLCVGAEKALLSCECNAVTHTLRLPHDFMLTLTKTMDTIDDDKVMFNLMRHRKLLISGVIKSSVLCEFITNVIHRL